MNCHKSIYKLIFSEHPFQKTIVFFSLCLECAVFAAVFRLKRMRTAKTQLHLSEVSEHSLSVGTSTGVASAADEDGGTDVASAACEDCYCQFELVGCLVSCRQFEFHHDIPNDVQFLRCLSLAILKIGQC